MANPIDRDTGTPADEAAAPAEKAEGESWIETVKTVVYALLIALVIRTVLFQPFNIPSSSMEHTLLIGDYLFVEKFAYGYSRYSLPYGHIFPSVGRIFGSSPSRGDVVVFKMPNPQSELYGEDFIKRVIGLPGDTIQVRNDRLYLNGKMVPRKYVGMATVQCQMDVLKSVPQFQETLPGGKSYITSDCDPNSSEDNTPTFVVPPGHYFMMGDNRDNSDDSRQEVGYVPAENLVGKAVIIFFSTNGTAQWWEVWKWPWTVRYDRTGTVID